MQARKASQRDWLVLTHHETGQEKDGRGHTDSRTEQTTKAGSDCVNKVSSQAENDEQRSRYLAGVTSMCTHGGHISPIYANCNLTTQVRTVGAF